MGGKKYSLFKQEVKTEVGGWKAKDIIYQGCVILSLALTTQYFNQQIIDSQLVITLDW